MQAVAAVITQFDPADNVAGIATGRRQKTNP